MYTAPMRRLDAPIRKLKVKFEFPRASEPATKLF
jgi:hypothetical protein